MSSNLKLMIVAGESSGDAHAAKLVRALREAMPGTAIEAFGAAGPKMRAAGVEAVVESDGLAIVGLAEITRVLPMFLKAFQKLKQAAIERKPDVVILVDFPDFNLRLAKALKRRGFRVIYYISPQLWAWRKHRVRSVKKNVDLMLTILPFESDWYLRHGFERVEYVGSPLAREVHAGTDKEGFCQKHGLEPGNPIISLLPGSRQKEILRILPVMLAAAARLEKSRLEIQFLIALSSDKYLEFAKTEISKYFIDPEIVVKRPIILIDETYDALNAADAAAVTSGTATLEAGIIGTPMVVVYKTSSLNYKLLEPIIDVPHYGLINLIAGKRVVNEFIQDEFTPESLSGELLRILEPTENASIRAGLKIAGDKLGHGGASKRAAEAILKNIGVLPGSE